MNGLSIILEVFAGMLDVGECCYGFRIPCVTGYQWLGSSSRVYICEVLRVYHIPSGGE